MFFYLVSNNSFVIYMYFIACDLTDFIVIRNFLILTMVIIITGIFGGYVNYFMNRNADEEKVDDNNRLRSYIITGIAAAALIPLFLNIGESQMFKNLLLFPCKSDVATDGYAYYRSYELFTFIGFCLLAAIYSKAFIEGLASKLLKNTNTKEINNIKKNQENLVHALTSEKEDVKETQLDEELKDKVEGLRDFGFAVIKVMGENKRKFFSPSLISELSGINQAKLDDLLSDLEDKELIERIKGTEATAWFLTENGIKTFYHNNQ